MKRANYNELMLLHDRSDKILPYVNSEQVRQSVNRARLEPIDNVGHYRMLWSDEVIANVYSFIAD